MAIYTKNVNLKGPKISYGAEQAAIPASSTVVPMLVVALDVEDLQESLDGDGYVVAKTNTDKSVVLYDSPTAVVVGQYVGEYLFDTVSGESRVISANTAASVAAEVQITVSRPFTTAITASASVSIRKWDRLYVPKLFTSLNDFANTYIAKTSTGSFDWGSSTNARYTLRSFFDNGGAICYVLPVESTGGPGEFAANLAPTTNANFLLAMEQIKPSIICMPKSPAYAIQPAAADYATSDSAWDTFVTNWATVDTTNEDLHAMVYVSDTPSASTAAAVTYRTTTLNSVSEYVTLCHGRHMVQSITAGKRQEVPLSPAFCGVVNRIATQSPDGLGHPLAGSNWAQVAALELVEELTTANKLNLQKNGLNALITTPGKGTFVNNYYTQLSTSSTRGESAFEFLNIMLVRNKVWNSVQSILAGAIDEKNTPLVRLGLETRMRSILDSFVRQGELTSFTLADTTTSADVVARTARFDLSILHPLGIDYIGLSLESKING